MRLQLLAAALTGSLVSLGSQQPAAPSTAAPASRGTFDFTIKGIMRGHELVGRTPADVRWSADNRWIYFAWNPPGADPREPLHAYRVRAEAGAVPESLTVAQMDSAGPLAASGPALSICAAVSDSGTAPASARTRYACSGSRGSAPGGFHAK